MILFITLPVAKTIDERRHQLLQDIAEESYLSDYQKDQLRAVVAHTDKSTVLDTVEDLLVRLFTRRAENYLLVVRKIQYALRLENRTLDKAQEATLQKAEQQEVEALLGELPTA